MLGLKRVSTRKQLDYNPMTIEIGEHIFTLTWGDLIKTNTDKKIKRYLIDAASEFGIDVSNIFVHINRDSSIAIATGQEPAVWPENHIIPE